MDKTSDDKTAPTKHKIPVGQAETKTTKSQTANSTKSKTSSKTAGKSESTSAVVKVAVKPATVAVNAKPIKAAAKPAKTPTAKSSPAKPTAPAKAPATRPASPSSHSSVPKVVVMGSAKAASRPAAPATNQTAPKATATRQSAPAHRAPQRQGRKWWMIGGIILAVLAMIGILVAIFLADGNSGEQPSDEPTDSTAQLEIDYNQKTTTPLGGTFSPEYQLGSDAPFSVRFVDLSCSDDACSNVRNVKFAGKVLASSAYQVKRGSVIIVLLADTMKDLKVGQYTLSFEITENGKTSLIGVKVKVVDTGNACPDGQTMRDGQCVPEDEQSDAEQKPADDQQNPDTSTDTNKPDNSGSSDQNSGSSSTSNTAKTEQQRCEAKVGPNRVLMVKWLSDAEKQQYANDANYQDGDEIMASGVAWAGATMKWLDGSCQPSVSNAENIGIGGGDWLLPRTDPTLSFATQSHPGQNFVVWYYPDGSSQLEFVNGDPMAYILNHF